MKILTYNTAMLPEYPPFRQEPGKLKRADKIASKILENNYDIICLQEVFYEQSREIIINKISQEYPFIVEKVSDDFLFFQDSGLFFASKYPFVNSKRKWNYILYNDKVDTDALSDKALFGCRLDISEGGAYRELFVFNTHLQSDRSYSSIRHKQLLQANKAVYNYLMRVRANISYSDVSAVLFGDLNIIGVPVNNNGSRSEYDNMIDALDYPADLFYDFTNGKPGYTWDGTLNKFIQENDPDDKDRQRLDYALAFKTIPLINRNWEKIPLRPLLCRNATIVKFTDNDLDLSDHYGLEIEIS